MERGNLSEGQTVLSPLASAASLGQVDAVLQMMEDGADSNGFNDCGDGSGTNAVIAAVAHGQCDVLRAILRHTKHPLRLDAITSTGLTALKAAVLNRDLATVEVILLNGARADVTNASGVTALMLAVLAGTLRLRDPGN